MLYACFVIECFLNKTLNQWVKISIYQCSYFFVLVHFKSLNVDCRMALCKFLMLWFIL